MKFVAAASKLAFVGTQFASRHSQPNSKGLVKVVTARSMIPSSSSSLVPAISHSRFQCRLFSSSSGGGQGAKLQNVGKEEMKEIVEDYENGGREDSGYVVMDVREPGEIAYTGALSEETINLPLQKLGEIDGFGLDEDEFEEAFGFAKPAMDETLVFSCAAGIRSVHAARLAAAHGYTQLVNYKGGSNEWFS